MNTRASSHCEMTHSWRMHRLPLLSG
jgi:hypothetical protein